MKAKATVAGRDRGVDLPRFEAANTGPRAAIVMADIDEYGARRAQRVVVGVAMRARDQDFVGHAARIGQARHLGDVVSRRCRTPPASVNAGGGTRG